MPPRLPSPDQTRGNSRDTLLSSEWHQSHGSQSGQGRGSWSQNEMITLRDNLITTGEMIHRRVMASVEKMSLLQRVLASIALVVIAILGIIFLVFNERIFHALEPFAMSWKQLRGGWTILWALTFLTAFPPMIGWSMCGTLAGFIYGIFEGWIIVMTASVAGSFCSLIVSRTVLRSYVERMVADDKRFAAFSLTLKHDGLKLLCMIRLCPLPYSISNGAMSTFPTVDPIMYAVATACVSPKLLIHCFIGSRLAAIARTGEKMTFKDRAVNWLSIAIGVSAGLFTGWFIYRKTMARVRELEAAEAQNHRSAAQDSPQYTHGRFSDDPEEQLAVNTNSFEDEDDDYAYFDDHPSSQHPYGDSLPAEREAFAGFDGANDAISLHDQRP